MDYKVKVNGVIRRSHLSKDSAETIAELLWMATGYNTQVIDSDGTVICEFES